MTYALRFLFIASMLLIVACQQRAAKGQYLSINDSKVFFTDQGEGETVVLLHGGLMDHTMWKHQLNALEKDYRVLKLDLRGHGESITGASDYIEVDAIKKLLDTLQIEQANIIGHSLGAIVALDFARIYPGKTLRVAVIAPGLAGFNLNHDPLLNKYSAEMGAAYSKSDTTAFIESFIKAWYDGHIEAQKINTKLRAHTKNMVTRTMKVNQWKYGPLLSAAPCDSASLHLLKQDIMVVYGDRDMIDIRMICELIDREALNSQQEIIRGGAHMLPLTFPDEINGLIETFLKRKVNP